jgi:hypothetical protein
VENERAPVPDGTLPKKYHLENSPTPIPGIKGEEIPKSIHHPMILASPRVNTNPTLASRNYKRDKILQGNVQKPIHDTDHITNVSEVKASRMAPRTNCCTKKPQPQLSFEEWCGRLLCCKTIRIRQTSHERCVFARN